VWSERNLEMQSLKVLKTEVHRAEASDISASKACLPEKHSQDVVKSASAVSTKELPPWLQRRAGRVRPKSDAITDVPSQPMKNDSGAGVASQPVNAEDESAVLLNNSAHASKLPLIQPAVVVACPVLSGRSEQTDEVVESNASMVGGASLGEPMGTLTDRNSQVQPGELANECSVKAAHRQERLKKKANAIVRKSMPQKQAALVDESINVAASNKVDGVVTSANLGESSCTKDVRESGNASDQAVSPPAVLHNPHRTPFQPTIVASTWSDELWQLQRLYATCEVQENDVGEHTLHLTHHCTDPEWDAVQWAPDGLQLEVKVPASYPDVSLEVPSLCVLGPADLPPKFVQIMPLLFAESISHAPRASSGVYQALKAVDKQLTT